MSYHSHADLGGQFGHGPVLPEREGEPFHAAWEARALALTLAMGATGQWNIDQTRSARETLPDYAASSYYAIWVKGLEKLLLEHRLVEPAELIAGHPLVAARHLPRLLRAADVPATLARGAPSLRAPAAPAKFAVGDRVRTRSGEVPHHTRLPHYVRGRLGRIEHNRGTHVYADSNAQGLGEGPQWLYTVLFTGCELWGADASEGLTVSVDAWEPYLERVQ